MKPSTVLEHLKEHIALMSPRQKESCASKLLIGAADEIRDLRKEINNMEKAFLLTKTHHD